MVELKLRRSHVSGHVSECVVRFVSLEKAVDAVALWSGGAWSYSILSVSRLFQSGFYVCANGQLV